MRNKVPIPCQPSRKSEFDRDWSYIADDSVANTHAFIDKRYEMLQVLGSQPVRGAAAKNWLRVCEVFPFGRYVIFYRVVTNAIEIVRILLGGRDTESIFEGHANTLIRVRDASDIRLKRWKNSSSRADLPD
ncbi:MAG: type II toxin-antitoxin system RelE/ParE family toxin [Candidatus Acidiferrum sp.]